MPINSLLVSILMLVLREGKLITTNHIMITTPFFLRWLLVWMLLLGVVSLSGAHQGSTHHGLKPAKADGWQGVRSLNTPTQEIQPILDLIANALRFMPLSHDDNLKVQALRTIAQALGTLAKLANTPDQKKQIRSLMGQTLLAISGFDNPDWKTELLRTTPVLAVPFSDPELVRELLPTIEQVADSIKDPIHKTLVLSELAHWATKAGDPQTAAMLLTQCRQVGSDTITRMLTHYRLDRLGPWLALSTQPQAAVADSNWIRPVLGQLGGVEDEGIQANILTRILRKIALVSDNAQRQDLQDKLIREIHGLLPPKLKARLLTGLVEAMVSLTDKSIRANRLAQLKQEAQRLPDKAAQGEVIRAIYLVGIRTGDQTVSQDEFMNSLQLKAGPFMGMSLVDGQSGVSLRLQILTKVLGTMARVAAQLGQSSLARHLTQQTLQAALGINTSPLLLRELATLTAKTTVPTADPSGALTLLRQAEGLVQGIDESRTQLIALGELVSLAAQTGEYPEAHALLKQALQGIIQTSKSAEVGGIFGGGLLGSLVASILQVTNNAEAQSLLDQVITSVRELPDGETKAQAYAEVVQSLHARAIHQGRLLDEDQAYALLNQALASAEAVPKSRSKAFVLMTLIHSVDELCPTQSRSLLTQSIVIATKLVYPEKGLVQSAIIEVMGSRARRVLVAGDERQARNLFDQAMQLWIGINDTPSKTQAAYTLIEKQAQALVVIHNPAVFQRWLNQTRALVKTLEPYASTMSLVVRAMTDAVRQTRDPQAARSLLTQALHLNQLATKPLFLSTLIQAGVTVLEQNQLKVLLTQSLKTIKGLRDRTAQARELIVLGHACAQGVPAEQVRDLITPILKLVEAIDNPGVKVYALRGLVTVNPAVDHKAPAPLFWQQVLAVANNLDDAAAQATTRASLADFQSISTVFLPREQIPSLAAQQQALQAANPSVRAEVYSKVAESMVYWHELPQATRLLDQVRPVYKIQVATGMLTGWLEQQQIRK
jgi:hypothetical protein